MYQKLMTKKIEKKMPPLYSTEKMKPEQVKIIVKYFTPFSNWTWYVTEGKWDDEEDWLFFGYIRGLENELGYFTLNDLKSIKGPFGLGVERDMHFGKHTLQEVMDKQL